MSGDSLLRDKDSGTHDGVSKRPKVSEMAPFFIGTCLRVAQYSPLTLRPPVDIRFGMLRSKNLFLIVNKTENC
ncbi:MAG TPA: hypothetical protein VK566_02435 [Nitrososphaeraceae archaeon]|nr:hypothetical protein [Nitrososphaeraceae archaeon]